MKCRKCGAIITENVCPVCGCRNKYTIRLLSGGKIRKRKIFIILNLIVIFVIFSPFLNNSAPKNQKISKETKSQQNNKTDYTHFVFEKNTSQSDYNYNVSEESCAYVFQNKLYMAKAGGITVYEFGKKPYLLTRDNSCSYLYMNDGGLYYKSHDKYKVIKDGQKNVLFDNVDRCYQLDNDIIYSDYNNELYLYNLNNHSTISLNQKVLRFLVDDINHRILTIDFKMQPRLIDFNGNIIKDDYEQYIFDDASHFYDGKIYYNNNEGIYCQDVLTGETKKLYSGYYYKPVVKMDNQDILYCLNENGFQIYDKEKDMSNIVEKDFIGYFISGDKVICYATENSKRAYYVVDRQGHCIKLK